MRILVVTHAPLSSEFGAGQVALSLGESLRKRGHQVEVWSSSSEKEGVAWWKVPGIQRAALDRFIGKGGPFDLIDVPVLFLTPKVAKCGFTVVRSVQPDLHYLLEDLSYFSGPLFTLRGVMKRLVNCVYGIYYTLLVVSGWRSAGHILCLGTLQLDWMKRTFPQWRSKMTCYFNATPIEERSSFETIRHGRNRYGKGAGMRFLWMGRWNPHKGTALLVDFIKERADSCPDDTFTVAGCGPKAENDFPPDLLRSGKVEIIPHFNRNKLFDLLACHEVGLFTSRVEGWGLGLNEMLESGMTVFSTNAGAFPDLREAFPKTLRRFPPPLKFELEYEPEESFRKYYEVFDWDKIAEEYLRQIDSKSI